MRTEKRTGNSISSRLRRLMMILVPLSALYIGIRTIHIAHENVIFAIGVKVAVLCRDICGLLY